MVQQATRVVEALSQQPEAQAKRLFTQAEEVLPLVKRVIVQTRSRVLEGKHVPSDRDQCSVSSSRTRARFPGTKAARRREFGRQVMLDEVEGGIVTRYEILEHRE